jgi:Mn-dependent DtxR family transcriptional regulator
LLGLNVNVLAAALSELQHRGLVEPVPRGGLRLKDVEALEKVVSQPREGGDGPTSITTRPRFTTRH